MLVVEQQKSYRIPLFCIVTMLFWFSMYTYVPILTAYAESLGATHKMAGIIAGSYGFVQMLLRIPVGIVSDRIHKRRLFISFGMLFTLLSGVGLWLSGSLTLVLIFRSLAGAAAATWVDFTILFSSYYKHEEATKAIGTLSFYNYIGQMTAMYFGGLLAEQVGWTAPFALGAGVGVIGFAASFFLVEKFEENAQKITPEGLKQVVTDRTLISVSLLAIISQLLTFSTAFGFTPLFANQELHATKYQMGLLTVFSTLPTAFASLLGGRYFAKRFGEKNLVIIGSMLVGVFTATIPFTGNFWFLLGTQIFAGFGRGLSFTMLMGLSIKDIPSDKRATAMGFFQAIYGLGMFVGPVVMGIIGDLVSLSQGFIYLGLIGILTALLTKFIIRENKV